MLEQGGVSLRLLDSLCKCFNWTKYFENNLVDERDEREPFNIFEDCRTSTTIGCYRPHQKASVAGKGTGTGSQEDLMTCHCTLHCERSVHFYGNCAGSLAPK